MNIPVSVGLLILAALLTFSAIATRKRYPKTSKNLFAALMIAVLFFSAASTSPTLVKALDEITTIATITDKATDTLTTEFTDTPYYEGQTPPSEIVAVIDGKTVTFTNLQMVNERTGPNGPYTLVDGDGNTLYFYEGSLIPDDEMAEGQGWVLIIPDGNGGSITVPAHAIQFGEAETTELEPEPEGEEILYITVIDGSTRVFTFTGDASLREVLSKACSNTIYLQSGSDPTIDEEDTLSDWVLRIYYGEGEDDFIEVPAHEVQLSDSSRTLGSGDAGEKYYYYKDGELYEFIWPGGGGEATVQGQVYEEIVSGTETSYIPIYLFEGSNPITDAGEIPSNWVLRIPDPSNPGQYIVVGDLSKVWLGSNLGPIEATGMKIFYYDSEGSTTILREFTGQTYSYTRTVYEGSSTVLMYEGSEDPGENHPENWVLRIYYGPGDGDYIEVPAHNVKVGNDLGAIEAKGMKLYYVKDGQLYEFIGDELHDLYGSDGVKPLFRHAGELPETEGEIPDGWVLRIWIDDTHYIEVPAHTDFVLNKIQGEDGPYDNVVYKDTDNDGEPDTYFVVLPDGVEVPASRVESTFAGVERLFFSLKKPGKKLWIGADPENPDLTDLDGNDIIEYSNGKFTIFFDLDTIVGQQPHDTYEIDAASITCGRYIYFSTEQPGSIRDNKIYPSGLGDKEFEKWDVLLYDKDTGSLSVWWSPKDVGVKSPEDIDAVSVIDVDGDGTLEVLFSIKGSSGPNEYPGQSGMMTAADIFIWDPDLSKFKKILEDGSNPEPGDDKHFDYSDHPPDNIDAMAVLIIGDQANQYLLSFTGGWYKAGKNDDPRGRYENEDIIFYDASAKTASMFFDGSKYIHGSEPDIDAVSYCGTILMYKGWVFLYDAQGHAHLFDAQGKPYIFNARGEATIQVGEEIVVFNAVGKAYVFDPKGYAYIYDLRGEGTVVTESYRYLVKSTTERPFTQTMRPQAQFITCYNYTNRTSTITLEHTTITTTFEVCVETTTTTSPTTSWFTSIVYSGFIPPDRNYMPLLLAGFLAILIIQVLTAKGDRKRNRIGDAAATLKA